MICIDDLSMHAQVYNHKALGKYELVDILFADCINPRARAASEGTTCSQIPSGGHPSSHKPVGMGGSLAW